MAVYRIAAVGVVGIVVLAVVAVVTGVVGLPSVVGIENRFGAVNDTDTVIETDLVVHNPNPVGANFGGTTVEYVVELNGIEMVTGTKRGISLPVGDTTLQFNSSLDNTRIPDWWVSHVASDEHSTLAVNASVTPGLVGRSFDAPTFRRPVDTDVESAFDETEPQPVPAAVGGTTATVVYVNETGGEWATVADDATPMDVRFDLWNPNDSPVTLTGIDYAVRMNGIDIGSDAVDKTVVIDPGETRTTDVTTVLETANLDDWWVSHLRNGQVTDLNVTYWATFDLSQIGGGSDVRVPMDGIRHALETDMLGETNTSAVTSA